MLKYLIYDTETTGKDIIHDKPFFVSYAFVDEHLNMYDKNYFYINGTSVHDIENKNKFDTALQEVSTIVGANIKFDVHMLLNAGYNFKLFENKNYIDIEVLARLTINNDLQSDPKFSVALKKLGAKYLGVNCADEEHILKTELSALISKHKEGMLNYFKQHNVWDNTLTRSKETAVINKIYNNWFKCYDEFPLLNTYRKDYLKQYPAPTYADISNLKDYGLNDAVITHGLFKLFYPKIVPLQQIETLVRISEATIPLLVMERQGMVLDMQRLLNDRAVLKKEFESIHIIDPRTNTEINIGQNAKLKELYSYEAGVEVASADKKARSYILDKSPSAANAEYLSKISKYLTTYVSRMLATAHLDNGEYKVYTQYNLAGTITGRLSSDFQQFPKEPLTLRDGTVINIRSWFKVPNGSKYMFYFDYSQLELRLQCEWTAIIGDGKPDKNMARAFIPLDCHKVGNDYYLDEDPNTKWEPTDLHALTAKHAFPNVTKDDPNWSHYRSLGKRTNFAVNYGASPAKISEALDVDMDTAQRLVDGYKHAFAGVVAFGKWLNSRVHYSPSTPNLFLRRYYSINKHQLQNWLVQGSGADLLLIKLRALYNYIKLHKNWHFMITVHDEVGFVCDDTDIPTLIKEIKEIKEIMYHKLTAIEIISDVEYTTTNWGAKKDWYEDQFIQEQSKNNIA